MWARMEKGHKGGETSRDIDSQEDLECGEFRLPKKPSVLPSWRHVVWVKFLEVRFGREDICIGQIVEFVDRRVQEEEKGDQDE